MNKILPNVVYIIMIALAFMLVVAIAPKGPYPPAGIALPAEKTFSPTSVNTVQVYSSKPVGAISLGWVNVAAHSEFQNPEREQETLDFAKALTASLGGNGIVYSGTAADGMKRLFGYQGGESIPGFMRKYVLRGEAISSSAGH